MFYIVAPGPMRFDNPRAKPPARNTPTAPKQPKGQHGRALGHTKQEAGRRRPTHCNPGPAPKQGRVAPSPTRHGGQGKKGAERPTRRMRAAAPTDRAEQAHSATQSPLLAGTQGRQDADHHLHGPR